VLEVADVFRRFSGGYLARHGASMLPSHHRAIRDILACRTPALGGHAYRCDRCGHEVFAWHSCKNRSCPKCHTEQTRAWLEKRRAQLLPAPYFHVIATVPEELRGICRANQKDAYAALMRATAESIVELARDMRYCGATVGVLAVLHTWTQRLDHHPHVHCLVTGGGVSDDGAHWLPARRNFLVPVKALSCLIRAKFRALLGKACPDLTVPPAVWRQKWVVHCVPWGTGETAVLDYLARYAFRVALTNGRLTALDDQGVTFRYKDRTKGYWRACRVSGEEFMRRFLQHVLPRGFHKVRYFGLWHPARREQMDRARFALQLEPVSASQPVAPSTTGNLTGTTAHKLQNGAACPCCRQGRMRHVRELPRPTARGP
jgi:hypothetical protein